MNRLAWRCTPSHADQTQSVQCLITPQLCCSKYCRYARKEWQEAIFIPYIHFPVNSHSSLHASYRIPEPHCNWNIVYQLPHPPVSHSLTHNDHTAVYSHKWHLMHSALIMCAVAYCISILQLSTSPSQEAIMVIWHLREERRKEGRSCQRDGGKGKDETKR